MWRMLTAVGFLYTIGAALPAQAQNYPWCAVYNTGDAAYNCGFASFEQCMTTVRGIGGFCRRNTLFQSPMLHSGRYR